MDSPNKFRHTQPVNFPGSQFEGRTWQSHVYVNQKLFFTAYGETKEECENNAALIESLPDLHYYLQKAYSSAFVQGGYAESASLSPIKKVIDKVDGALVHAKHFERSAEAYEQDGGTSGWKDVQSS